MRRRDDGLPKRRRTWTGSGSPGPLNGVPEQRFGLGHVRMHHAQNRFDGDGLFTLMPAIVIRDQGQGCITDFRFPRELGFRRIGHPDNVHAPLPIQQGFRFRGKLRSLDTEIRSAHVKRGIRRPG